MIHPKHIIPSLKKKEGYDRKRKSSAQEKNNVTYNFNSNTGYKKMRDQCKSLSS